jgi:hypothetical protein
MRPLLRVQSKTNQLGASRMIGRPTRQVSLSSLSSEPLSQSLVFLSLADKAVTRLRARAG